MADMPLWPNDADGDVLRRIWKSGKIDFSVDQMIDFQMDFDEWPPSKEALKLLRLKFGSAENH